MNINFHISQATADETYTWPISLRLYDGDAIFGLDFYRDGHIDVVTGTKDNARIAPIEDADIDVGYPLLELAKMQMEAT